jgi:hypothetical protein
MFQRTIILQAEPPVQIVLNFDSKSNAEKHHESGVEFEDDYGQKVRIGHTAVVLSDVVVNVAEQFRAQGEIEIVKARAEMQFHERVDKDAPLKAFRIKKQTEAAMRNAPRVAMPMGGQ